MTQQAGAGLYAVGLCVPVGRSSAAQLEELARLADAYGSGEVRFTIDQNVLIVIREMRLAAYSADEHRDPGTVDLFARFVQMHEKHEWWLRDMLRRGDGLVT